MFDWLKRRKVNSVKTVPGFRNAWGERAMPSPGAMNYAYLTLALVPFAPSGPTGLPRSQIRAFAPQLYNAQAVIVAGIPTVSGQLVHQPLTNPGAV